MMTFLKRRTLISIGTGVLLACTVLLFLSWGEGKTDKLFIRAKKAFDDKDYNVLAALVEKYPAYLHNYRKNLTLELLKTKQTEHTHFSDTLKRLQAYCPLQAKASYISLLISKGELESALEESLSLDADLQKQESSGSIVQPGAIVKMVNLLRIAELHSFLGHFQEEVEAWEKLERLVGWGDQKTLQDALAYNEALPLLERGFQEQGIDLKEYIHFRKQNSAMLN